MKLTTFLGAALCAASLALLASVSECSRANTRLAVVTVERDGAAKSLETEINAGRARAQADALQLSNVLSSVKGNESQAWENGFALGAASCAH